MGNPVKNLFRHSLGNVSHQKSSAKDADMRQHTGENHSLQLSFKCDTLSHCHAELVSASFSNETSFRINLLDRDCLS
jgi:hypothetical protein